MNAIRQARLRSQLKEIDHHLEQMDRLGLSSAKGSDQMAQTLRNKRRQIERELESFNHSLTNNKRF